MTRTSAPRRKTPISRFVLPLISIGILVFLWRYNLKWGTIPVIAFLIVYYWLLPKVSRAMTVQFNRKAILLLTRGKAVEVPLLVRRSFFFQLIAPKGVLEAKLALAYLECEQFSAALQSFEASVPYVEASERPALLTGLIKALFVTGDFARAEAEALDFVRHVTKLPELLAILARARIGLGKNDDETKRLLDEAEKLSPSTDVQLMIDLIRIESALIAGRKPPALSESSDSTRKLLRAWIHLIRGLLRAHRGDAEKAVQSFEKARATLPQGFIAAAATRNLEAVSEKSPGLLSDDLGAAGDARFRKKKKKRR